MPKPIAGEHYPATWTQFLDWFPSDKACAAYLERVRWPAGFACPQCGVLSEPYRASRARLMCRECGHQASAIAGTIFQKTRTPLRSWFVAAWHVTSQKHGVSSLGLQRALGLGSYQTAWAIMHRFRRAMVRPERERLKGAVEVDEVYIGLGDREAQPRQKQKTAKLLIVVAVEVHEPKGIGRIRVQRIPARSQEHLQPFVEASIDPAAEVRTDGALVYGFLPKTGYLHHRTTVQEIVQGVSRMAASLGAVNRVASLLQRWLLGTHHGAVQPALLDYYLDEFVFRFNRRTSNSRGLLFYRLLEQAVQTEPVTYRDIVDRQRQPPPTEADWS